MLTPKQASDILDSLPHAEPVYTKRRGQEGEHIKYAYRYALPGPQLRHISIATRELEHGGATVYVNAKSSNGSDYPVGGISDIQIVERYPKGYKGKTGDIGISAAAGGLSTLLPADHEVYRLRVASIRAFNSLLRWYCSWDGSSTAAKLANSEQKGTPVLHADKLAQNFVKAFTGTLGRRVSGGRGINSGRDWFATVYTEHLSGQNVIEVAFELNALASLLGCSEKLATLWLHHIQQHIGNLAIGHKADKPWPCAGFTSEEAFLKMLADWKELKKSWRLTGKAHIDLSATSATSFEVPSTILTGESSNNPDLAHPQAEQPVTELSISTEREPAIDEITLREIKTRRGQTQFRSDLIKVYDGKCAFSGCDVLDVLEGAHIVPHSQGGSYAISNGLLLRADLHTLFDLKMIGIDRARRIWVSKRLYGTMYQELDGKMARVPKQA